MSRDFWNERYAGEELVYGAAPNDFLAMMAERLPRGGRALDLGAGEGRNALFLASRGFDVLAVDQSEVGMRKAQRLADERGLKLRTQAVDLADLVAERGRGGQSPFVATTPQMGTVPGEESFDVVSSIFVHLPATLRAAVHQRVRAWLKPGGAFVLEAYAPDQIGRGTGGPQDPSLLAPLEAILDELQGLEIEHQAAVVRKVCEGQFHTGEASVVQVVARKR